MLDLVFGVMLATSPLNDPMDNTSLDKRGPARPPMEVTAIEPAAGQTAAAGSGFADRVILRSSRRSGGGER